MPNTAEEVKEIVEIANKYKIPVIPWVSGINFGSIATPSKGGIVIDLRRMNRVLEVNEDDMYAIVSACPFCLNQFKANVKNNEIQAFDLSELVKKAL